MHFGFENAKAYLFWLNEPVFAANDPTTFDPRKS